MAEPVLQRSRIVASIGERIAAGVPEQLVVATAALSSCQFIEQCLRLLQIARVKPFGEPAIDRGHPTVSRHTER